eukprot:9498903-Pyramimonas_sp.AAC.1
MNTRWRTRDCEAPALPSEGWGRGRLANREVSGEVDASRGSSVTSHCLILPSSSSFSCSSFSHSDRLILPIPPHPPHPWRPRGSAP